MTTMTTMSVLTKRGEIKSKHPVREDFAGCSTGTAGTGYYDTKGSAVHAFESALAEYGLCFDCDSFIGMPGDDGSIEIEVWTDSPECADCVGRVILSWHRMEFSGHYEFIGYIT